jgi:ubiquitin C-terminal hydrolase
MDNLTDISNISGLDNYGNSCYFNSSLQLLKPVFDTLLQNFNKYDNDLKNKIVKYYSVYKDNDNLKKMYSYICEKLSSNKRQQDSHEALSVLLDDIVDNMSDENKSIFSVRVKYNNLIRCSNCNEFKICNDGVEQINNYLISYCFTDPNMNRYMNIHKQMPFDKFLGSVLIRENIDTSLLNTFRKENKKCNCDIKYLGMQTVLTKMPTFLFVYVNRCSFERQTKIFDKLSISDKFSITTPVSLENRCKYGEKSNVNNTYNLHGIVYHSGKSMNGGHYYSYIKNIIDQSWYLCNDGIVNKINDFDYNDINIQQNCVILLYIKKN